MQLTGKQNPGHLDALTEVQSGGASPIPLIGTLEVSRWSVRAAGAAN